MVNLCFHTTVSFPDIEYAKNYAKMAESAKALASQQVTAAYFCTNKMVKS